jgi:hypothetical protein
MRQQQQAPAKKTTGKSNKTVFVIPSLKPVMADSFEVMELYYTERIQSFSEMLDQLNLLQDASAIEFLCREIIDARKTIAAIAEKKKSQLYKLNNPGK